MSDLSQKDASSWRRWLIIVGCLISLCGAGYGGWQAYKKWQPERLARQANDLLQKGDIKSAAVAVRRALQISPNDLAATRVMAELTDRIGIPETVLWRRRVAELDGDSTPATLRWAAAALRFHQYPVARHAMQKIPERDRHSADYHAKAGAVAIGSGNAREAAAHFAAAVNIEPENDTHKYNNATAQLMTGSALDRQNALAILERFCASTKFRTMARRVLISDFAAHGDLSGAIVHSNQLIGEPEAIFRDWLTRLDLLERTKHPQFEASLSEIKTRASNPADAGALIAWLDQHGMTQAAIDYSQTLGDAFRESAPVGMALAPCLEKTGDWNALLAIAKKANWGEQEYLRAAYLTKAFRELGNENAARTQWNAAVTASSKNSDAAKRLLQMTAVWKWSDEMRDLLWASVKDSDDRVWALAQLYGYYREKQSTRGLQQVTTRMLEMDPSNEVLQNNYAMYSLLLKLNVDSAFQTARDLYARNPSNRIAVATYAFALHVRGRSDEALQLMNTMTIDQIEEPSTAIYYGLVLAANGAAESAAHYLELAKNATLLPEEKELLESARTGAPKPKQLNGIKTY